MYLFRNSSLGQFQSSLSVYHQLSSHESAMRDPEETRKLCQWVCGKQQEATGTPPEALWCISLYEVMTSNDQGRRQGEEIPVLSVKTNISKVQQTLAESGKANQCQCIDQYLLSNKYTLPNTMCPLKHLLQQSVTCTFPR